MFYTRFVDLLSLHPTARGFVLHTLFDYLLLPAEALLSKEEYLRVFCQIKSRDRCFFDPLIFMLCSTMKAAVLTPFLCRCSTSYVKCGVDGRKRDSSYQTPPSFGLRECPTAFSCNGRGALLSSKEECTRKSKTCSPDVHFHPMRTKHRNRLSSMSAAKRGTGFSTS